MSPKTPSKTHKNAPTRGDFPKREEIYRPDELALYFCRFCKKWYYLKDYDIDHFMCKKCRLMVGGDTQIAP